MKIGLEVHVALPTKTKLFCSCKAFAEEPNTSICPICMGMPGSKPKLNKEALRLGLSVASALNCKIKSSTGFVRKVYFYPDLPKSYQISQLYDPVGYEGYIELSDKKIGIRRVQLEEDPARIYREDDYTLLDFNRSGTPLLEIVTEPDIASEEELREFYAELRSILYYFGIEIDREMKADLNISLSGPRVEIKNITGIKNLIDAARYEVKRQGEMLERGEKPQTETRSYIPERMATERTREKETDEEYGYIFEPDLTFYSTSVELIKPVYASKIAKEYAQRYNANEKTLKELIAYDKNSLELLEASAEKHGIQEIIAALELLKKYKVAMGPDYFSKVVELIEKRVDIDEEKLKAIAEGKNVTVGEGISEKRIIEEIERFVKDNPWIVEEIKKNPKSINTIVGKVSKSIGANPRAVLELAKKLLG
ncbi:MAG: Asp-tRNA(Asn)/Glu-tRNA(Gln) amidotransferase subunit GatB [Candidatus Micrarchaeaceae archaeon]